MFFLSLYVSACEFNFFTESFCQTLKLDKAPLGLRWVASFGQHLHVGSFVLLRDNFTIYFDVTGNYVDSIYDCNLQGKYGKQMKTINGKQK